MINISCLHWRKQTVSDKRWQNMLHQARRNRGEGVGRRATAPSDFKVDL